MDIVDACSMLYRLEMEGKIRVNKKNRQNLKVEAVGVNEQLSAPIRRPIRNMQILPQRALNLR